MSIRDVNTVVSRRWDHLHNRIFHGYLCEPPISLIFNLIYVNFTKIQSKLEYLRGEYAYTLSCGMWLKISSASSGPVQTVKRQMPAIAKRIKEFRVLVVFSTS